MIQPSFNNIEPCLLQFHKLLFRQSVPFQVNTILSFMGSKITILIVTNNEIYPVSQSVNESMDVNNTKFALVFGSARILPMLVSNSIDSARLSAVNRKKTAEVGKTAGGKGRKIISSEIFHNLVSGNKCWIYFSTRQGYVKVQKSHVKQNLQL